MKNSVKRPQFWLAVVSLLSALCLAVVSSIVYPRISVLDKLKKGINKHDTSAMVSCFLPDVQAELTRNGIDVLNTFEKVRNDNQINIIYGEAVADDNGNSSVPAFIIYNQGKQCTGVECQVFSLESIDGKLYMSVD